jgi:hypothetical protein
MTKSRNRIELWNIKKISANPKFVTIFIWSKNLFYLLFSFWVRERREKVKKKLLKREKATKKTNK